jgi:hypothetical protein
VIDIGTEVKKEEVKDPAPESALAAEVKTEEVRQIGIRARIYGQLEPWLMKMPLKM